VSWGRSSNVFLRNGARLYLDVGSHPEYATPECDDPVELITHDKAGDAGSGGLADRRPAAPARRRRGRRRLPVQEQHRLAGNSYGCHENYLVGRQGEFSHMADVLIPFLVTRQLIAGAGKVLQTPRGPSTRSASARAHLGGHLQRHDAVAPDHQHP
jgi:proteasome accessory factor A